ncbi:MAG: lamin tail domain-containing protein [Prevotellaceae bacterium]|jgi:Na+-transporting methylmalonyl-CoA/oxaloacetate decarboxylase gamma subunit|nr:lamin tail domain-containing protein [Prevotellaceae bacterium]
MNKKIKHCLLTLLLLGSLSASAQKATDLRINEFMATNQTNYEDDFGERSAWIELFNSSYGTVDVGGCYLSDDRNNLTKYQIPKGDVLTLIKPRQHTIFWADNKPTHGTFHLNFRIDDTRFLALTSSDGKTIIDSLSYPTQRTDVSYARSKDGAGVWNYCEFTTPSTNNLLVQVEAASQQFLVKDPTGLAMAFTAMSVVFMALILLFLVFKHIGKAMSAPKKEAKKEEVRQTAVAPEKGEAKEPAAGAVYAAIAMALREYELEMMEMESNILTINKVAKAYSPWSSKIYGLRQNPTKK